MELLISSVLFLTLSGCLWKSEAQKYHDVLTVPNGGQWGTWGNTVFCHEGYAFGFSLKVDPYSPLKFWKDDTSLNGIRLHCTDGKAIESTSGLLGTWSEIEKCKRGNLVSFSMSVEPPQGIFDDTAANNIHFMCDDGSTLKSKSPSWGKFGPWSNNCTTGFICGIQTKVENNQNSSDMTGLNDVRMFCCD
ncbi:vitelline membrane outer layer protein 1-like [Podarcis raffonei]|uniref:vitelline membrane outer layer protein 1-like n=1 Tax=Podarcis raffonei TaxID=65483 RepID=UPI0023299313|nr:vitelline membrane outer layer protein 1-like [Podarcis raffonei]